MNIDSHHTIEDVAIVLGQSFAKAIGESEGAVRLLEQGIIPNGDYKIINKIESYLKVNLRKGI